MALDGRYLPEQGQPAVRSRNGALGAAAGPIVAAVRWAGGEVGLQLPVPPTPLVGRDEQLASIRQRLLRPTVRLLTLTGPAGVGKTRLALAVAAELAGAFEAGVGFIDLAPLSDPRLVLPTLAQALGVREAEEGPLLAGLARGLQGVAMLLVLDNFEQVLEAAPQLGELLGRCPTLKVLVTSRAPLRLRCEHAFPVRPLELPNLRRLPALEALPSYAAVGLFLERAQAAQPDFVLGAENAEAVAEICVRLDGLPLAIELAAARTRVLPPGALRTWLGQRLALLTTGASDLPARHQTLRAAIDWSYDLLPVEEQALFRRLAVFVGGFTLEAAEAVANVDGALHTSVLDGVASLVDKSLLRQDVQLSGEPRLVMLETVREYALERLVASGEADAIGRRHAEYFLSMAEWARSQLSGTEQVTWLNELEREHDNLRTALAWLREHGESELGLRLGGALWQFWSVRGHFAEGRAWLEELLRQPAAAARSAARANALNGAGSLAFSQGDDARAQLLFEESLAIWRELGDEREAAHSLSDLGRVAYERGDAAAALSLYEESLAAQRWATHGAWRDRSSDSATWRPAEATSTWPAATTPRAWSCGASWATGGA
jgi:non-specific serine/threonine protein kinase